MCLPASARTHARALARTHRHARVSPTDQNVSSLPLYVCACVCSHRVSPSHAILAPRFATPANLRRIIALVRSRGSRDRRRSLDDPPDRRVDPKIQRSSAPRARRHGALLTISRGCRSHPRSPPLVCHPTNSLSCRARGAREEPSACETRVHASARASSVSFRAGRAGRAARRIIIILTIRAGRVV
jgi:hypothetical protein